MIRKLTIENKEVYYGDRINNQLITYLSNNQIKSIFLCVDIALRNSEIFLKLENDLSSFNIVVYDNITPNPKEDEIMKAAMMLKENDIDCIVGFGGGSVLDAAKMIALMADHEGNIVEYSTHWKNQKQFTHKSYRTIGIPTTAGTGSEMDGGATVVGSNGHKVSVGSNFLSYDAVFVDPSNIYSCPKKVLVGCAIDALSHSFESLMGDNEMIFSQLAMESIKLVYNNLLLAYETNENVYKDKLTKASFLSGCVLGFEMTTHGLPVHSIGLPLAEKYHISHGESLGLVMPYILDDIVENNPSNIAFIAENLGIKGDDYSKAKTLVNNIKTLFNKLGINSKNLIDGNDADIDELSTMACLSKTTTGNKILPYTKDMCKKLYERVFSN